MGHKAFAAVFVLGLAWGHAVHAEGGQVYCKYRYYNDQYSMCAAPPIAEAKKACEEKAEKKHGEKLSCWCTDDPAYIRDYCEQYGDVKD